MTLSDSNLVALTIYGEGRGERVEGRIAIGCVIRNRVMADLKSDNLPDWWGEGYEAVCLKEGQFSCWNPKDPNRPLLRLLSQKLMEGLPLNDTAFEECQWIAEGVVSRRARDRTTGATHYYANNITPPKWTTGAEFVTQVGRHLFFKNVR